MAKNNDFSDLSIGGGIGKYKKQNEETARRERAEALDLRIRAATEGKRSEEWAKKAIAFCDEEELANRDVFDLSLEAHTLSKLRSDAQLILNKARTDRENTEKRIEKEKAESLKNAALELDRKIDLLADAEKNRYWCDDVAETDAAVRRAPKSVTILCRNLSKLEKLMLVSVSVRKACDMDDTLAKLNTELTHDDAWCSRVDALSVSDTFRPYMKNAAMIDKLRAEKKQAEDLKKQAELNAKQEAEALKKQKEAESKQAAAEQAKALDDTIRELDDSPRSSYWCDAVEEADKTASSLPMSVKMHCRQLPVLDGMLLEVEAVRQAAAFDRRIIELKKVKRRDSAWAKEVNLAIEESVGAFTEYLIQSETLEKLKTEAAELVYGDKKTPYEELLQKADSGITEAVCKEYDNLNGKKKVLSEIKERDGAFITRWNRLGESVAKKKEQLTTEAARIEAEEKKEAARIEADRQKQLKHKKMQNGLTQLLCKFWMLIPALCVIVGALVFGFITGDRWTVAWFIIGGTAYALLFNQIFYRTKSSATTWVFLSAQCVLGIVSAVCLFLPEKTVYAMSLAIIVAVTALLYFIQLLCAYLNDEDRCYEAMTAVYTLAAGIFLIACAAAMPYTGFARMFIIGIAAIFTYVGATIGYCLLSPCFSEGVAFVVVSIVLAVGAVACLFFPREYLVLAAALSLAAVGSGIALLVKYNDNDGGVAAVVCGAVTLIVSIAVLFLFKGLSDYRIKDGVLVHYYGQETVIVIPEEITSIGNGCFRGNRKITEFVIPESVTEIGNKAFKNCKNLKTLTVNSHLKFIGEKAFYGCENLENLIFSENATVETIGGNAFAFSNLQNLTDLPDGVKTIGEYAFFSCQIGSIRIPDTVETIESNALIYCDNLRAVYIGSGVKALGNSLFEKTPLLFDVYYNGTAEEWERINKDDVFADMFGNKLDKGCQLHFNEE